MRKILLYSSALVVSGLLSGVAEAACIQTPSCSSLGYTSSQSCNGGVKCPFGNAWNCMASDLSNKITEVTNKITEITNKITTIEEKIVTIESGASSSNCKIGDILYSDKSCDQNFVTPNKPIGVVFDRANRLALALDTEIKAWSDDFFDVPTLPNYTSSSAAIADWQGKNNTRLVLEYCKTRGKSCPAFEYVNSYKTEGTNAGDWYLPAAGELNAIYNNRIVLNDALKKIGAATLEVGEYWSSSESSSADAWTHNFYYGEVNSYLKHYNNRDVRPVLAF